MIQQKHRYVYTEELGCCITGTWEEQVKWPRSSIPGRGIGTVKPLSDQHRPKIGDSPKHDRAQAHYKVNREDPFRLDGAIRQIPLGLCPHVHSHRRQLCRSPAPRSKVLLVLFDSLVPIYKYQTNEYLSSFMGDSKVPSNCNLINTKQLGLRQTYDFQRSFRLPK